MDVTTAAEVLVKIVKVESASKAAEELGLAYVMTSR